MDIGPGFQPYRHGNWSLEIFIQTFLSPASYAFRQDQADNRPLVLFKREWRGFMKLPIITVVVDNIDPENGSIKCNFSLSIPGYLYFAKYSEIIQQGEGKVL